MTGTIDNAAPQVITDLKHDALQLGFTNDSGAALSEGQEVILKTAGTVDKRSSGTTRPIGVVIKGGANAARVTVRTCFTAVLNGIAKGGTINAGTFVKPNGTLNADGKPQYVAAVAWDYSLAIVVKGGAVDSEIKIAILDAPVLLP